MNYTYLFYFAVFIIGHFIGFKNGKESLKNEMQVYRIYSNVMKNYGGIGAVIDKLQHYDETHK